MGKDIPLHLGCGDLSVGAGQGKNLVAGGLHGAGLMDMNMAAFGAENPLMRPQSGGDHRQISLGAANQKVNGGIAAAGSLNFFRRPGAVQILAVAGSLLQIGGCKSLQHLLVAALAVVIVKENHSNPPWSVFLLY